MGTTVAFLAECQGSLSVEEQKKLLAPDDQVLIAGRHSFTKLDDILTEHSLSLSEGDRVKVFDLACIPLSTTTLVRLIANLLRRGVAFEIASAGIVIEPAGDDKLHALLDALDGHHRHMHGVKTQRSDGGIRGRKRLLELEMLPEIQARLQAPGVTATEVASDLGVARSTLFNFLDRYDRERREGRGKKVVEGNIEHARDDRHVVEGKIKKRAG